MMKVGMNVSDRAKFKKMVSQDCTPEYVSRVLRVELAAIERDWPKPEVAPVEDEEDL